MASARALAAFVLAALAAVATSSPLLRARGGDAVQAPRFARVRAYGGELVKADFATLAAAMAKDAGPCQADMTEDLRKKLNNWVYARSHMGWYQDPQVDAASVPTAVAVCEWLHALKAQIPSDNDKSVLIVGGGPAGLSLGLRLMLKLKFTKEKPLIMVEKMKTRELLHLVSTTKNTMLGHADKYREIGGCNGEDYGMKDLATLTGIDKLLGARFGGANDQVVTSWAVITNYLLLTVKVLKNRLGDGVIARRGISVSAGDAPEAQPPFNYDSFKDGLKAKEAMTVYVSEERLRARLGPERTVFRPDRVYFAFGGGGRDPVVQKLVDGNLLGGVTTAPALLKRKDADFQANKHRHGQLFAAFIFKRGDGDTSRCHQFKAAWNNRYVGNDKTVWDQLAMMPPAGSVFAKTSAVIGDEGKTDSLCHLEFPFKMPDCTLLEAGALKDFCNGLLGTPRSEVIKRGDHRPIRALTAFTDGDTKANIKQHILSNGAISDEDLGVTLVDELKGVPAEGKRALSVLMALAPNTEDTFKKRYEWFLELLKQTVQLKFWRTAYEAIVTSNNDLQGKVGNGNAGPNVPLKGVVCGHKKGDQGIFFVGDACRDAHPDLSMGVNDGALQADMLTTYFADLDVSIRRLNAWESTVEAYIANKAKGWADWKWYNADYYTPAHSEACSLHRRNGGAPLCDAPNDLNQWKGKACDPNRYTY